MIRFLQQWRDRLRFTRTVRLPDGEYDAVQIAGLTREYQERQQLTEKLMVLREEFLSMASPELARRMRHHDD